MDHMNKIRKAWMAFLGVVTGTTTAKSQGAPAPVEMADTLRSNGKIYVVVAVMATILTGLIVYLLRIDRRVSRLEKDKQ